jgi:hypothetical protein
MKDYVIMIINALVLIVIGAIGYIMSGSPTALIADGGRSDITNPVLPRKKSKPYCRAYSRCLNAVNRRFFYYSRYKKKQCNGYSNGNSFVYRF